jgi:hypothetical protein
MHDEIKVTSWFGHTTSSEETMATIMQAWNSVKQTMEDKRVISQGP